jgi:hypothetical protein
VWQDNTRLFLFCRYPKEPRQVKLIDIHSLAIVAIVFAHANEPEQNWQRNCHDWDLTIFFIRVFISQKNKSLRQKWLRTNSGLSPLEPPLLILLACGVAPSDCIVLLHARVNLFVRTLVACRSLGLLASHGLFGYHILGLRFLASGTYKNESLLI